MIQCRGAIEHPFSHAAADTRVQAGVRVVQLCAGQPARHSTVVTLSVWRSACWLASRQASPADLDRGPAATGKTSLAAFLAKRRKPVLDDDGADAAID